MTSDKNQAKPFKDAQDQDPGKPKLKEVSEVEAKLAKLEAEVAAKASAAPLPVPVSEAVATPSKPAAKAKSTDKQKQPEAEGLFKHAHINMAAFWFFAVGSIVLANAPGFELLMTPVNQFVVMIHESSHAIVALLTGGHPAVSIIPDGVGHGGITETNGGWLFFTAQAGYLGTTLYGCLLVYLAQFVKHSKKILMGVGIITIALSLIFITPTILSARIVSGLFSMMWGLFLGIACVFMGKKLSPLWANLVLLFLAIQTALNSVTLAWALVPHALGLAGPGFSDATIMAQFFFIPAVIWALMWILMSLAMLTLKFTYGKALLNRKKASQ